MGYGSVVLVLFFALGFGVELGSALCFGLCFGVLVRLFCFACDMGFGMVDLGCGLRNGVKV